MPAVQVKNNISPTVPTTPVEVNVTMPALPDYPELPAPVKIPVPAPVPVPVPAPVPVPHPVREPVMIPVPVPAPPPAIAVQPVFPMPFATPCDPWGAPPAAPCNGNAQLT